MRHLITGLTALLLSAPPWVSAQPAPPELGPPAPAGVQGEAPAPASPAVTFDQLEVELRSDDVDTRAQAALALGQLGGQKCLPLLLRALRADPEPVVRQAAATALALLPSPKSTTALRTAAEDDADPAVREAAREALDSTAQSPGAQPAPRRGAADMGVPPPIPEKDLQPASPRRTPSTPAYNPENHPNYTRTRRLRTAGILVTAIGGGVGLAGAVLGGLSWGVCGAVAAESFESETDCTTPMGITIAGGVTLGVALAVGIPMIVSGQRKLNDIQRGEANLLPQLNLAISNKSQSFSARWRF